MTVIDLKTMREVSSPSASVLCLGNFDGVHAGHMALIREAIQKKAVLSAKYGDVVSGACFFRTPPSDYMLASPIPQLTTFEQKLELFAHCGLDYAFVMDFSEIGELSPADFVNSVLKQDFHCVYAVCGYNFHFGKSAAGDATLLDTLMKGELSVIAPVLVDGNIVSSSAIRQKIADGEMHLIPPLLGRPYCIQAEVLHGKALGRTIGIPTVNQYFPGNLAVPKLGIYITQTAVNGKERPSVTNVGIRPSVDDGTRVNCETHILDFDGDLYGQCVTVRFIKRLRDEIRFESLDALKEQIQRDITTTREYGKEAPVL